MEHVLDTYERPHDPRRPVVCFDERPCQLLGDVLMPIPMKRGRIERQDYHYTRHGICVVLMAIEPLAGHRSVKVTDRKTKKDYAKFMRDLASHYPDAIRLSWSRIISIRITPLHFMKLLTRLKPSRYLNGLRWCILPRKQAGLLWPRLNCLHSQNNVLIGALTK